MKWLTIVLAVALAAAMGALAFHAKPGSAQVNKRTDDKTLLMNGEAVLSQAPDSAELALGVERRAPTAREAYREAVLALNRIVEALKKAGVPAEDIQTERIWIERVLDKNGRKIVAYEAGALAGVRVGKLERAGAVLDAGFEAGATQIEGPRLVVSNEKELCRKALKEAFADARAKAQALTAAAGLPLGRVVDLSESGCSAENMRSDGYEEYSISFADARIEPGTHRVVARIGVTFELQ